MELRAGKVLGQMIKANTGAREIGELAVFTEIKKNSSVLTILIKQAKGALTLGKKIEPLFEEALNRVAAK